MRCRTVRDRLDEMWRSLHVVRLWWFAALPRDVAAATLTVWGSEGSSLPMALLHPPGDPSPPLLLHAHLDVVPAPEAAFEPRRDGDRIVARGSADMKGAAAVMLHLAAELLPRSAPFGVLFTWNEEVGGRRASGLGTEAFLKDLAGYRPEFFLSGERSGLAIAHRSKGMLRILLTVRGRSAHAATPWEGDNALERALRGIAALPLGGDPDGTTVSVTFARAGTEALNVVPGEATVGLDARVVTAEERERILSMLSDRLPGAEIRIVLDEPGASCAVDHPHLARLSDALRQCGVEPRLFTKPHASDVRLANEVGVDGAVLGPEGGGVHGEEEWVSIRSLEIYREVLRRFVTGA